jgi:hypothetical protein
MASGWLQSVIVASRLLMCRIASLQQLQLSADSVKGLLNTGQLLLHRNPDGPVGEALAMSS